ncbi:mannonate dehydratase [Devosia riboflavina]|uniref:mannonate dehydratase n=1 Tax=Devosia riboflavina TaxID=46914 RepID=A0A087M339_9HYPH|nr:mannonate dehydratase [Devosia riboflavina]KFL31292.1 mannonate dehydratase [Devosia riboflavina]
MYVGTQLSGEKFNEVGDAHLRQLAQLGLRHVCVDPVGNPHDWTREVLERHIERIEAAGLVLDMVQLPMSSAGVDKVKSPSIVMGRDPDREREVDSICRLIETLGALGIKAAKYNFNILGIPRTPSERGRGGAIMSTFRHDQTTDDAVPSSAGTVSADEMWERITWFLERVVPVAEASKVRLACHPHDPLTRPGYRGMEERVLGSAEGLKKFVSIVESPYHGLNFCQGTVAESLENPREEIGDIIRWFGERKKIFNVHFRNIKGGRYSFTEEFPDAGDMDMAASLKIYKEVGVDCMIMPDHVPHIDGEAPFETAFAFCYGYIIGLFQANGWDPYGA